LAKAKQTVIEQMVEWIGAWNCSGECGPHGTCLIDACVCEKGYQGVNCEEKTQSKRAYDAAVICSVALPFVVLIAAVIVAWLVCYRRGKVFRKWPESIKTIN
jgi:hypothetical protein